MSFSAELAQSLINYAPVPLHATLPNCAQDAFSILMYHRVCPAYKNRPRCPWGVTPRHFKSQLEGLLEQGYEAWPLSRVLDARRRDELVPGNVFVVTFDDGYANNLHWGLPVLKQLNVPATIFLATSFLDSSQPFPSDEWEMAGKTEVPAKTWLPLTTAQGEELLASGLIELGAHTHRHHNLSEVPELAEVEILTSLMDVQERFGLDQIAFAFPFGAVPSTFDERLIGRLQEAGMSCALTTDESPIKPGDSPFNWGRFTVLQCDTTATIAAKLDGHYSLLRDTWRSLRGK